MIPFIGAFVRMNLTDTQREQLGGNHSDDAGGTKQAPAVITNIFTNGNVI